MVGLTVLAGLVMGGLGERLAGRDVAIGIVLALALAFGLLCLHFLTGSAVQATALLFGNVLGVDPPTLWALGGLAVLSLGGLAVISGPLLFATLEPDLAEAKGVPVRPAATLFLAVVALAVAGAAQIVGVLLVFALMVGPPAAALRLTGRIGAALLLSAGLALAEAWAGLLLAYLSDWPTSFCITALSAGVYGASLSAGGWPARLPSRR